MTAQALYLGENLTERLAPGCIILVSAFNSNDRHSLAVLLILKGCPGCYTLKIL